MKAARQWYRVENVASDPSVVDIHIVDIIGGWIDEWLGDTQGVITAKQFLNDIAKLPDAVKTIRLHINSPGGDVQGAVNMANALRDQQTSRGRTVESIVDGIAASAASIVMMAGSKVTMADNALVMIHDPMMVSIGDAADMRKSADILDTIKGQIIATYQWHSSKSVDELAAMMTAESWMDADEAIEAGLATDKVEGLKAAAVIDPKSLAKLNVPDKFKARVDALLKPAPAEPVLASANEILAAVAAAGLDTAFAQELVAAALPMEQVTARVDTAKAERTARATRASDIRALCATAKVPQLADSYIDGGMSVEAVRTQLTTVTALVDRVEIDSHPPTDPKNNSKPAIDVVAVYAARNRLAKS